MRARAQASGIRNAAQAQADQIRAAAMKEVAELRAQALKEINSLKAGASDAPGAVAAARLMQRLRATEALKQLKADGAATAGAMFKSLF